MKNTLLAICLFVSVGTAAAQKLDSLKLNNRKFKHEIGIDFRGVLNFGNIYYYANNVRGGYNNANVTSLIYKVRNDRGKLVAVSYAKNWRFQLRTSSTTSTDRTQRFESNGQTFTYKEDGFSNFYINPAVGIERVNFFNRFNFYYGADFGLSYSRSRGLSNFGYVLNGNGFLFTTNADAFGSGATAFLGMKYRISERFSISIESAFEIYFSWIKSSLYDDVQKETVSREAYESFGHLFKPLRLLTFNYHFKQF